MADFFDKVVLGINKGVNAFNENSKNLVDKAKLSMQISEREEKKAKALQRLGVLIYNMYGKETFNEAVIQPLYEEIKAYNQEIKGLQKLKLNLEETKKVPSPLSQITIEEGETCQCGYINKKGAKFCTNCGTKF